MHVCIVILVLDFTFIDINAIKIILTQVVKFIERKEFAFQKSSFYLVSNTFSKNLPFGAGFTWVLFLFHVLLPSLVSVIIPIIHTFSFVYH
jgi:hypothetical protein